MLYDRERMELAGLTVFRKYLAVLWAHLKLPPPTRTQNEIADFMQYGPARMMVEAFRGVGKSWIAAAFITWGLLLDPQLRNIVISATKDRADNFSIFTKQIIIGYDLLQPLAPRKDQRTANIQFDVAPAEPDQSPSVKSVGITGQITGTRADIAVLDDIEIPKNSFTHMLREKLSNQIREVGGAILKPDTELRKSRVIYLGTPQSEQSVYSQLPDRGYEIRIWPSEVPSKTHVYMGRLAESIMAMVSRGLPEGTPTDPERFNEFDLEARKAEYGVAGYALQFMLDTSPSDEEKHPLKLRDLIVTDLDSTVAHTKYVWGREANGKSTAIEDLGAAGFEGDRYLRPVWKEEQMLPYTGSVMFVDPSGQGKDETSYAIVKHLFGQLFLLEVGGFKDGFGPETLHSLALAAFRHKVNIVVCEPNYGGGMFDELLKPVVWKVHKCGFEPAEWSKGQKELRIIDTLQPVLQQHRLIVDRKVIEEDLKLVESSDKEHSLHYSCFWQLSHITRDRGSIPHEDRLEAIAGAVAYWVTSMARDTDKASEEHKQELVEESLKKFLEQFNTHTPSAPEVSLMSDSNDDKWA